MRTTISVVMACLVALAMPSTAAEIESVADLMRAPGESRGREVAFRCRYAVAAALFKASDTAFDPDRHANFVVWPDTARLWDKAERKGLLPTLYVDTAQADLMHTLGSLRRYDSIVVSGTVLDVQDGYPRILVSGLEPAATPNAGRVGAVIDTMARGVEALAAKSGAEAADRFEEALRQGLPPEWRAEAHVLLAQAHLLDNRPDKARDGLRRAVADAGADVLLRLALADVCLRLADGPEALAQCEAALAAGGGDSRVRGLMAEAHSLLGEHAQAAADIDLAVRAGGSPRDRAMTTVRRARVSARAGRLVEAGGSYADASGPGSALADEAWLHNEIGLFHERLRREDGDAGRLDKARAAYAEAVRLDGACGEYLYNLAEAEFGRRRLAAPPDFSPVRAILDRIGPDAAEHLSARVLEGRILFAEGKADEAERNYQAVAARLGNDAMALLALAEALSDVGDAEAAANAARRAESLAPWNPRIATLAAGMASGRALSANRVEMVRLPESYPAPELSVLPGLSESAETRPSASAGAGNLKARLPFPGESTHWLPKGNAEARPVTVRPGEGIRIDKAGVVSVVPAERFDRDIQTSVSPAKTGSGMPANPATKVRIPGLTPHGGDAVRKKHHDDDSPSAARPFPATVSSSSAYASPAAGSREPLAGLDRGGATPVSFPTETDPSPLGIFGRTPAATDKDPHRPGADASTMTAPGDGRIHRAEVLLPGSSRGFGHTSDYR